MKAKSVTYHTRKEPPDMSWKKIVHETYTVEIEAPEVYVDNEARKRT